MRTRDPNTALLVAAVVLLVALIGLLMSCRGERTEAAPTASPPTASPPVVRPPVVPPRMGAARVPAGTDYDLSSDGRAFTMRFSTLEATMPDGDSRKSLSATLPVSGDTVVELSASGYVLTEGTATLTVTACGDTQRFAFGPGTDSSYVKTVRVALRRTTRCGITLTVEVQSAGREASGFAGVTALDGRLR